MERLAFNPNAYPLALVVVQEMPVCLVSPAGFLLDAIDTWLVLRSKVQ